MNNAGSAYPAVSDRIERQLRIMIGMLIRIGSDVRRAATGPIIMNAPSAKLAYSIDEAVAATSISRSVIYEDIAAGRLTALKRGRSTIILAADLAAYLAALPPYGELKA